MNATLRTPFLAALATLCGALPSQAQSFTSGAAQVPQGNPFNNSSTENVDFADVDHDGDYDAVFADGGDDGNDQNRLWINQGGLQGGTVGVFVDRTSAQLPSVQDTSRDVDFVDIDRDGDEDLYVSNDSTQINQSNRWHVNQGGLQGGTAGYFVDETSTRWVDLGVNNGTTAFSSVAASMVLPGGGFIDYSGEGVFGDLDDDGDMDLLHTSYGSVFDGRTPSRLFLNDGAGFYEEFNPSGFQLPGQDINNGDPALWANGLHQHDTQVFNGSQADIAATALGAELGDLDGDFDLDLLIGARDEQPRMFINRLEQNGGVLTTFVDVTYGAFTDFNVENGHYEQELGDMDDDDDLDVYGVNWSITVPQLNDITQLNDGTGHFGAWTVVSGSSSDGSDCDWFDYDDDGYLDVFVATFGGQDRLYENDGPPGYGLTDVTSTQFVPEAKTTLGLDSVDVDHDGDSDLMTCNDSHQANDLWINVTQVADASAPRVLVEQAPDQNGTSNPTPIRAVVHDNASWDVIRYYATAIEYSVNGGPTQTTPMIDAGGQLFYGAIPGGLVGQIDYAVVSTDQGGNAGVSSTLSFTISATVNYCTAGTSASGCQALLSATGTPSATAPSGFTVAAAAVEGQKDGLFYFGSNGRQANPWGNGTSYQCVVPPVARGPLMAGAGTLGLCDGTFGLDLNALWCPTCPKPQKNPGVGAVVQAQLWYRDPQSTSNQTTSLSDAIEFAMAP
jgi:hypothetical protein